MSGRSWTLRGECEWVAHDPFGKVKPGDLSNGQRQVADAGGAVALRAARNGYVSFRLLVQGEGEYRLTASLGRGLEVDVYRAWYHRMASEEGQPVTYSPDALVPVAQGQVHELPDPAKRHGLSRVAQRAVESKAPLGQVLPTVETSGACRIEGQTTQEFWVDVFVPADAEPGEVRGAVQLASGGREIELPVRVQVLELAVPEEPCVVLDHNSYGWQWLRGMYPSVFDRAPESEGRWGRVIELLHHYYRIVHEHRGTFHNLGPNHAGTFAPIYGPRTVGAGRRKSLTDWELHDELLGPLLDGTAFERSAPGCPPPRRPARPLGSVYSPITPDWPASYLWWGEPGYEVEFARCLKQFDAHYRQQGWTQTNVEFFFNHKKRYRWFEWDGDEPKDAKDDAYHIQMERMWRAAIQGSPVKWVYRMDASWQMRSQFERLRGLVDFWVLGGFCRWYPEETRAVIDRGDIVWWYGGSPSIAEPSSDVLQNVYRTWARGFGGYCAWLTVSPGSDPWFSCDGAATGTIYPGERFGIRGPIPSIRLKLQRNGLQDIDLIHRAAEARGALEAVREELASQVPIRVWEETPPAARVLPPEEWDSRVLALEVEPRLRPLEKLDPLWWTCVRELALSQEAR